MVAALDPPKIIFVDDESMVLNGLRRSLRPYRRTWDMTFCEGAQAALAHLAEHPCDIIVSDMRMPEMDGAELLEIVQKEHPGMVRIVLSGYSEKERIMQTVNSAHQYLSKPCQLEALKAVFDRTIGLAQKLNSQELKSLVGKIASLPTPPRLYHEVLQAIKNDQCTPEELAVIIETDPAMVGKLLKMVNSSFFALGQPVKNCADAIACLGHETIHALILHAHIFSVFPTEYSTHFNIESWQQSCMKAATLSKQIALEKQQGEAEANDAFVAALLKDIGELLFVMHDCHGYAALRKKCKEEKVSIHEAEMETYGTSHSIVGSYLIGIWGLSYSLVEAVAYHHTPSDSLTKEWNELPACHISGMLADMETFDLSIEQSDLDFDYLSSFSITPDNLTKYQEAFKAL